MFNVSDITRNNFMLTGPLAYRGYDWWWHNFSAENVSTGEKKSFFIEFFTCNPALGGDFPVLGQLPENKKEGKKPSYLCVKAGCWGEDHCQLHRFFGWNDVKTDFIDCFSITADDCFLSETKTTGSVQVSAEENAAHPELMCDSGSMKWDLNISKKIAFNVGYGASAPLREAKAFEMYWHAEGMKTLYEGKVWINGEEYKVTPKESYGYSDKNWGKDFTSPWIWLSSSNLYSTLYDKKLENSVFDIGGGRPKVYFVPLNRELLGAMYYEGEEFEYNFSKFWTLPRTKFGCVETDDCMYWKVWQANENSVMKVDVCCEKKDMILINYEAPDGEKKHNRLLNGATGTGRIRLYRKEKGCLKLIDDIHAENVGCEFGVFDE